MPSFKPHANVDTRHLYRFDVLKTQVFPVYSETERDEDGHPKLTHYEKKLVPAGWSHSLYADDKRSAIKKFVSLTSPTTRFECVDLTERNAELATA